ncbi:MAG: hypothetical protein ACJAVO_002175 [Parvibaculaceae bacterium]|jgi:hypothetical protein
MVFEGKRGAKAGKTVLRILTTPNEGTKSREIMQTTRSKATQKQNILRTSLIVLSACLVGALSLAAPALAASKGQQAPEVDGRDKNTYTEEEVINAGKEFLGGTAQGLANVVHKIFAEFGEPNAYIRGEEAGGAIGVGLMYGDGLLVMKNGTSQKVYWQGPSAGWDFGGNAAKVFTLVYDLPTTQAIYQRFPGVEGSAYFVGGLGVTYQRRGDVVLAPIRAGVGFRLGANVGYSKYTAEREWLPF